MTYSAYLDSLGAFLRHIPYRELAYTLGMVAVAVALMIHYRLRFVREFVVSFVRVFLQLALVGGLLLVFFEINHLGLNVAATGLMVLVAGWTAAERSPRPGAFWISLGSQAIAAAVTLAPVCLLGVIELRASFFIPIVAMIVRNCLDRASLAFERLEREFRQNRELVEQYLTLGLDPGTASRELVRQSIEASMIPTLNKNKVVGLVGIPGLMTGMIVTADPENLADTVAYAASLQAIVLYLIFTASIFTSMMIASWMRGRYFNDREQLVAEGAAG